MKAKIQMVAGVEGNAFYIGDTRIAGPKPWGGGNVVCEKETELKDILYALNNLFDPTHQPLASEKEEIEKLFKSLVVVQTRESMEV